MPDSQAVLVRFCTKFREIFRGVATNFWSGITNPKMTLNLCRLRGSVG